ncbi:tetratricopeptide repeat protein [Granulicella aggregans]|uniref:tetratricopeptide repeat protein n=1 Tax=Granulicella aggregans TaxID=474949 RepID=UPI0021DFD81D|nr:tetratricopeptide repeat protein [Granulicella aggregans]
MKRITLVPLLFATVYLRGQIAPPTDSVLKQHYDLAQSLQSSGKFADAARQYRIFIADGLAEMALQTAAVGEYSKAEPLFDESLRLAPRSPGLKVRYAQAAFAANDFSRTRTLTESILREYPDNTKAAAKAHYLLGSALRKMNQEAASRSHFEAAVALDTSFENGYALAVAYLDLDDGAAATKIFSEMVSGLGDTAALHVEIGRAYLNSDFQQMAIPEFRKAIALDSKLPGAHYALALTLLTLGGDNSNAEARSELEAELKLSPNDASTHAQLGNIALQEERYPDAEKELKRAEELDSTDPKVSFYLGQMYAGEKRNNDAMAAFRRSIALTKDPAQNRYMVQKTHYMLGRLLIQAGDSEAGRQEMQLSSALLKRSLSKDRDRLAGDFEQKGASPDGTAPAASATAADPKRAQAVTALADFERRIAPALADSYNNLGVIAANENSTAEAVLSFQHASMWNPALPGLDENWGLAAARSGLYSEAIQPLTRSLKAQPSNPEVRAQLAISLFRTNDCAETLRVLAPITADVAATPELSYAHAVSLIKTGKEDAGMKELLEAIKLAPRNAALYAGLGAVELEQGKLSDAIAHMEQAEKLDASDAENHRRLAQAYRKAKRNADADREQAIYGTISKSSTSGAVADLP